MSFLKTANNGTTTTASTTTKTGTATVFNFGQKIEELRAKAEEITRSIKKLPDPTPRVEALKRGHADVAQIEADLATLRDTELLKEARAFAVSIDEAEDTYATLVNVNFNQEAKAAIAKLESTLKTLERHLKYATEDMGEIDAAIAKLEAAVKAAEEEQKTKKKAPAAPADTADDPDADTDTDADEDEDYDEVPLSEKFDYYPEARLAKLEAKFEKFIAAKAANPSLVIKDTKSGKAVGYYLRFGKRYFPITDIDDLDEGEVVFGYLEGKKFHPVKNDTAEYIVQQLLRGAENDPW